MASQEVIHAYRHLYRWLLRAVQYSSPAKYTIRTQIRRAFRKPGSTLDANAVKRTIWFLQAAAKERGMEHAILKNMLMVAWHREKHIESGGNQWKGVLIRRDMKPKTVLAKFGVARGTPFQHYDMTVAMLNKTMGTCLQWTGPDRY